MLERSFGMSYTSVSAMLAIPAPEDDGATASDHHPRAIAELDRASDAAVELGERPLEPVMWLLAPESRYHLCSCSPFTAPRQT
jgi:hypothetical protein